MAGKMAPHIKPGLITALVLTALTLFFYFTGIKTGNVLQMTLRVLVVAVAVAAACFMFAKQQPEAMGKDVFFFGFRVTAIITLCSIAFGILFVLLVPQFKDDAIAVFQKEQLSSRNHPAPDPVKIAEDIALYKKRFLTLFIGMNMMIVVVSGLIGSLVGTLITTKK